MIEAIFKNEGRTISLEMSGHANFTDSGVDPACAWASALGYTAIEEVRAYHRHGDLMCLPELIADPGHIVVRCIPWHYAYNQVLRSFSVVQTGLVLLQQNLPENCHVTTFNQA